MNRSSWYAGTLRSIAASGYVVIAPDSETGRFPSHARLADDLNRSLRWLGAQSVSGTLGVPRGKVDPTRLAVAGHSMGGGVALLAATRSRSIDTVVTFAAAETAPRASVAVRRLRVPSLFIVGSDDRIVPAASTAVMFRRAPSPTPREHHGWLALRVHGGRSGHMRRRLHLIRPAAPAHSEAGTALARPLSPTYEDDAHHRAARHSLRQRIKRAPQMPSPANPRAHRT